MNPTTHFEYSFDDLAQYNFLRRILKQFPDDLVNQSAYLVVWFALEAVRNKYGGNPPKQLLRAHNGV
jgi:hypothetical protein